MVMLQNSYYTLQASVSRIVVLENSVYIFISVQLVKIVKLCVEVGRCQCTTTEGLSKPEFPENNVQQ